MRLDAELDGMMRMRPVPAHGESVGAMFTMFDHVVNEWQPLHPESIGEMCAANDHCVVTVTVMLCVLTPGTLDVTGIVAVNVPADPMSDELIVTVTLAGRPPPVVEIDADAHPLAPE